MNQGKKTAPQMRCIIVDDDPMSVTILSHLIAQTDFLTLQGSFQDPVSAASYLESNSTDLLFLDIEMPGMTGLEMLGVLSAPPLVIIVSSKGEHALAAFDFDVVDYLLKPISQNRFLKAVIKAKDRIQKEEEPEIAFRGNFIFVKSDAVLVKLDIRDILWVEALADYVAIITPHKKHVCHSTMKAIESKLPSSQFARIHRSYIVRLDRIDAIEDNSVSVDGKLIPVGGTYRESLMSSLDFI
jgi:two-component system, LytTR family, response regulator